MYQCKTPQISSSKAQRVISEAQRIIRELRAASPGSRPYIRVKFLEKRGRVYIHDFHYHIDAKRLSDRVGRYQILPCVVELLTHTSDLPLPTIHGNLMLDGITPDGERFRVIIRPEKRGGTLQSFFPF